MNFKQPFRISVKSLLAVGVVAIALTSCTSSKAKDCVAILKTLEESRQQQVLGEQTRDAILQNATLSNTLADQLDAMTIKTKTLRDYTDTMATGYRADAEASQDYAAMTNEEGIVSIRSGDTEREQSFDRIQADQRRAANQIQLGFEQIGSFCAR